jgi:hypothetical protein
METNKQVFSIVGPHTGHYYGDIVFILSRDLMSHPDFSVTCSAATYFNSGRVFDNYRWLGRKSSADQHQIVYHQMKMNAAQPDFDEVLACLLTAMCGKGDNVSLKDFLTWWRAQDSHDVLEGHLPAVISVAAIEKIIIPQDIFDALTPYERAALKTWMPERCIVQTSPLGANTNPSDISHPPRRELMVKAFEVAQEPVSRPMPGFTFTSKYSPEATLFGLPIHVPKDWKEVHFYFRAIGTAFFVVLGDKSSTILINITRGDALAHGFAFIAANSTPSDAGVLRPHLPQLSAAKKASSLPGFGKKLCGQDHADYHITFVCTSKTVRVEHCGGSFYIAQEKLELSSADFPGYVRSFNLFGADTNVTFEGVRIFDRAQKDLTPVIATPTVTLPTPAKRAAGQTTGGPATTAAPPSTTAPVPPTPPPATTTRLPSPIASSAQVKWSWESDQGELEYSPADMLIIEAAYQVRPDVFSCLLVANRRMHAYRASRQTSSSTRSTFL